MEGTHDSHTDTNGDQSEISLSDLTSGSTILVASPNDPTQYAVGLRALCQFGTANERALVVTTTESADQTIETYESLCSEDERPSIGIVDTTSEQQSIAATYEGIPVVFTPSPEDLERLVIGLSDLTENAPPSSEARHLLIRSLTPILERSPTERVCTVLERIVGLRTETGLCLIGLNYTAHDEATMAALAEQADGILWVTESTAGQLEFEYQPTRGPGQHVLTRKTTDE